MNAAVAAGDFSSLPYQTQGALHGMWKTVRKEGYAVEFRVRESEHDLTGPPAARLTGETEVPDPTLSVIEGVTTISGRIEQVGGVKRSKVHIRVGPKKLVRCTISRAIARSIASRLYTYVSVSGTAKWDAASLDMVAFDVVNVEPYEPGSMVTALRELAVASGGAYDKVMDPTAYVRDLRGENDGV